MSKQKPKSIGIDIVTEIQSDTYDMLVLAVKNPSLYGIRRERDVDVYYTDGMVQVSFVLNAPHTQWEMIERSDNTYINMFSRLYKAVGSPLRVYAISKEIDYTKAEFTLWLDGGKITRF